MKPLKFFFPLVLCFAFFFHAHAQFIFKKIDQRDISAIHLFLKEDLDNEELLKTLSYKIEDVPPTADFSVISYSAKENCLECLKAFVGKRDKLETYIDVQKELDKSVSFAVINNNIPMLEYLLEQHADLNSLCTTCYNRNPLQISLGHRHYAMFFKLLSLGADTRTFDSFGQNLFHLLFVPYEKNYALPEEVSRKTTDTILAIIDTLVARGVDIHRKERDGITPLMSAVQTDDPEVFDHFTTKGAIVDPQNKQEFVTLLRLTTMDDSSVDGSISHSLFKKLIHDYPSGLTKETIDTPDIFNDYLLNLTIYSRNRFEFDLLMNLNANIHFSDQFNWTPINLALDKGDAYMCNRLLDAGAVLDKNTGKYKKIFKNNPELINKFKNATQKL